MGLLAADVNRLRRSGAAVGLAHRGRRSGAMAARKLRMALAPVAHGCLCLTHGTTACARAHAILRAGAPGEGASGAMRGACRVRPCAECRSRARPTWRVL